jgi:flagellar biosynthesis/type III secretory pathway ATPase
MPELVLPLLEQQRATIAGVPRLSLCGRTSRVAGLVVEASGIDVALGELCTVSTTRGEPLLAEVVGFHDGGALLMPLGQLDGIRPGGYVEPLGRRLGAEVGMGMLGRVVNALGEPIDGRGPLGPTRSVPIAAEPPQPLARSTITEPLETGVRAIDGMLTIGKGQRVGIFAGSGAVARCASSWMTRSARRGWRARSWWWPPATRPPCCAPAARSSPPPSRSTTATWDCTCCSCWTRSRAWPWPGARSA